MSGGVNVGVVNVAQSPCIICFTSQKICAWEQEGHAVLGGVTGQILPGHPRRRIEVAHKSSFLCCFLIFYEKCIFYRAIKHKGLKPTVVLCVTFTMRHFPFLKILIYT